MLPCVGSWIGFLSCVEKKTVFYTSADQVQKLKYLSNTILFSGLYNLLQHPLGNWMDKLNDAYDVPLCYTTVRTGCRSISSVRITFRRYHERIALWDHRTALWARLWPALTKTADEWRRNFEKFERFKFNCLRRFKTERNTRRILGINCEQWKERNICW